MTEIPSPSVESWPADSIRPVSLEPWCLVGVLNVTPDSFSDGGLHLRSDAAVAAGGRLVEDGAGLLDVGGESTRPGASRITAAEQVERIVPVIQGLRDRSETCSTPISVDTTRAAVAEAAISAGADVVNDVSGGFEDPDLLPMVADRGVGLVLMHRLVPPDQDSYSDRYDRPPVYEDVVDEVRFSLARSVEAAVSAGVAESRVAVDPGLGFGKTVPQNLELIRRLSEIAADGLPVLLGASRKSFLGAVGGVSTPAGRDLESVVAAVEGWRRGARLIRVHDVAVHRRGLETARAVDRGGIGFESISPGS